ncbi:pyrroloquinoline quinone biosynthesis protein PqqB [Acidocella sp.]|uniref:pyrroloquinoline quinone biosynthesis protein PqqB n=1 Tax=Acidocella sp. TaxID=50710 RepID=UPI002616045D|nr:pyrroloquinoline quinone biosynthesis protein PqqB [Acidocella sp.]
MQIKVLGAAAGGGFPQWNCNCQGCRRARLNEPHVRPRTQASIAISADGACWTLLNASPDLPCQLRETTILHPRPAGGMRHSPLAAVVLSSGDVDCIAGLLSLRESQPLALYADTLVRGIIEDNQIFRVLNRELVPLRALPAGAATALHDAGGTPLGLTVAAFPVAGKIPLYQETSDDIRQLTSDKAVIGLSLQAGSRKMVFIPGCAAVDDELLHHIEHADVLFFDGTLWDDDEMIRAGTGRKTGARMGHMCISGAGGSMAALARVNVGRKIFIHINNTNPVLCDDSPEAAAVRAAGWEIAHDGMELKL